MSEHRVVIRLDDEDEVEALLLEFIKNIPRNRRQERLRRILYLGYGIESKTIGHARKGRPKK